VVLGPDFVQGKPGAKQVVALPGVQGLITDPRRKAELFARDGSHVWHVALGAEPRVETWAANVNVGPSVLAQLDGDAQPDVLSVIEGGVATISGAKQAVQELALPVRVLDVSSLRDASQAERGLALVVAPASAELALAVLPPLPWASAGELVLRPGEVHDLPGLASVALE
jgi:hypothetical protein